MDRDRGMPEGLERVVVPPEAGELPVPRFVDCFIRDAEDRAEEYGARPGKGLFFPGDYRYAFQILQWLLRTKAAAKGASFLEWGSGQGMVTILAALLGLSSMRTRGPILPTARTMEAAPTALPEGPTALLATGLNTPYKPITVRT